MFVYTLFTEDSLGKVDKSSLSQQTLMELLSEGIIEHKDRIHADIDDPGDDPEWLQVKFNMVNEITHILWYSLALRGSIELKWLPITTVAAYFSFNKLTGTADLTCLPNGLKSVSLGSNYFHGTVDLTCLPSGLQRIYLYSNEFCGRTDFTHLPASTIELNIRDTQLEGEIIKFEGKLNIENSRVKDMRMKE